MKSPMPNLRAVVMRFISLFRHAERDRELAAELESHLQMHIDDGLRTGMSPAEARRQALIKLGGVEQTKEKYRERHGLPWLESLLQDVRFGLRMLRTNPGFTAVAVLTLALGIGANTAIFSVVDAVLLNPIPFSHPGQLVDLYEKTNVSPRAGIPYPDLLDWQQENRSFEGIAGYMGDAFTFTGSGAPLRLNGERISANFFSVLAVRPILGRTFRAQEDQLGAAPVALISEGFWKRAFGSDPEILGKSIELNGIAHTVVGVIPADFHLFSRFDSRAKDAVFVPLGQWNIGELRERDMRMGLTGVGRLKRGVTAPQAQAEMDQIAANLAKTFPKSNAKIGAAVIPMAKDVGGELRPALLILLGAVGLVLLIACANVANLLLARSTRRAQEFAVRAALGATRARLRRQLLVESGILALLGGGVGIAFASWGTEHLLGIFPAVLPTIVHVNMNLKVLAVAIGASLFSVLLFGLAPAFKGFEADLQCGLKEGGRGASSGRHHTQRAFVVIEIALSVVLLVAAGLLIRSFVRIWSTNPGFDPNNVLTISVSPSPASLARPAKALAAFRQLRNQVSQIPGVESVSLGLGSVPFSGSWSAAPVWRNGEPTPAAIAQWHWAAAVAASPGYFHTLRIPLIRGRGFTEQDGLTSPPVLVIGQELANELFPGQNPIGKRLDFGPAATEEIVGVVGHVLPTTLEGDASSPIHAQMYMPYAQTLSLNVPSSVLLIVRSSVKPLSLVSEIRNRVGATDANAVVYDARMMNEMISGSLAQRRFSMILLGTFASIALLLAAIGIYGVISYVVGQRTHEIGIRMALGAQPRDILRDVLGEGGKMALAGVALGLVASFGLTRLMDSMLFRVSATDPLTFAAVVTMLLGAALLACWIPARRATRVDPMVALRHE
ncbi:MAG: ADOP family duplicated permease [Candidatus Acidiferrales bacterium]